MPGDAGVTVVTMLVCFLFFACEAAGASRARHSLRPHLCWAGKFMHHSGVEPSRECGGVRGLSEVVVDCQTSSLRGANATKQSSFLIRAKMDCFVVSLLAMTAWQSVAVMPGLVPGIHLLSVAHTTEGRGWPGRCAKLASRSPAMTQEGWG